jgi:hypothetical protein
LHLLLNLQVTNLGGEFDSTILQGLSGLGILSLKGTSDIPLQLDDEFWGTLKNLPKLQRLSLDYGVTDTLIEGMSTLATLQVLTIRYGELNSTTVADVIGSLPELVELHLFNVDLSEAAIKQLDSLTKLKRLDIRSNPKLTTVAVESLHEALPNCRIESDHGTFEPTVAVDRPANE